MKIAEKGVTTRTTTAPHDVAIGLGARVAMKIVTHVEEGIDEENPVVTVTTAMTMPTKDAKNGADVVVDRGLATTLAEPVIMVETDIEKTTLRNEKTITIAKALNAERVCVFVYIFRTY